MTGDVLTIRGETASEEKVEQGSYLRQERRFGKFERSLTLPKAEQAKLKSITCPAVAPLVF